MSNISILLDHIIMSPRLSVRSQPPSLRLWKVAPGGGGADFGIGAGAAESATRSSIPQ